jgi:hypothetical protein
MIYTRTQLTPSGGGSINTAFDMTILNTGDSADAGSEKSKIGNYDVTFRRHERMTIVKTETVRIEGFPRKEFAAEELLFLALYGVIGKEKCEKLIKRMKKGVSDAKTKRTPKAPPAIGTIHRGKAKGQNKIVYGRGASPK